MIRKINKKLIAVVALAMALVLAVSAVVSFPSDKITDVIKEQETETRRSYLILGKDKVSGLCDVIMIGSVDPVGDSAILLQIPRDTYAVYSEKGYRKLNGALNTLGAEGFCEFISKNFGVAIDGYLLFDLEVFKRAVDAIGGVDVDLPFDMDYDDPYQGLSIHLDAGRQHLDGAEAEKFVRYRSGYVRGDLGRLDAQKIFMSALFKKLLETEQNNIEQMKPFL